MRFIGYCSHATNRSDKFQRWDTPPNRKTFYALFTGDGRMFTIKLNKGVRLGELPEDVLALVVQNNDCDMHPRTLLFDLERQFA